ncbi:alpha/beta hydrolase [Oribacterium sp. P6A1]|uniref:alpha/beta hydrolase n=1 Tax=Oribacterium sp. P6A1 TaxID=1410612 RepID=UPI00056CD3BB|nr:prolyl oligopeptidase family serine peptidase [Oribacterium sp. P6A1]
MTIKGIFDAELVYDEKQEDKLNSGILPGVISETYNKARFSEEEILRNYDAALHGGKQSGTIIVFPGGGYSWLSDREGEPVVKAFNRYGFRALILRYDCESEILGLRPLKQAAWAIAETKRLFPGEPVYLCGFSAGAHCAASVGIHYDDVDWNGHALFEDVIAFLKKEDHGNRYSTEEKESMISSEELQAYQNKLSELFRADGMILGYPVISSGEYAHRGSFERLLGKRKDFVDKYGDDTDYERALRWFSLELQVHETTPEAFIWQTMTDDSVPVQNSLLLVNAMIEHDIKAEYHMYPSGVHGLSLATKEVETPDKGRYPDIHVADWFERAVDWLLYKK